MTPRERVRAVLSGSAHDLIPFVMYEELVPRGEFERELRDRGAALLLFFSPVRSETPNVSVLYHTECSVRTATYRTPAGEISERSRTHMTKLDQSGAIGIDGMIKCEGDFDPVIAMIDDIQYQVDPAVYQTAISRIGEDGIVFVPGPDAPFSATISYFGSHGGLTNWIYAQQDYPKAFARLVAAQNRKTERQLIAILDSPAEIIALGAIDGQEGRRLFTDGGVVDYYRDSVQRFHSRGKMCSVHTHAANNSIYLDLIGASHVDILESYAAPPMGDTTLMEARHVCGEETPIIVAAPENEFLLGPERTREYVLSLIESDPRPDRLMFGLSEMGTFGLTPETEMVFKDGIRALMDALEEHGSP